MKTSSLKIAGKKIFRNRTKNIWTFLVILGLLIFIGNLTVSANSASYNFISGSKSSGSFTLAESGKVAPLMLSAEDFPGVLRVAGYIQNDVEKVTGVKPELIVGKIPSSKEIIIAGTIGKSPLIAELIRNKKIDVAGIEGKWESTLTQVVENPFPGIKKALVIVGSDKRGTIYGLLTLSKNIGVSPWYWWADVPVQKASSLYVKKGTYLSGEPKVKYRGIFLNDEEPALGRWAVKNYGGFKHEFYEKVFELILRLKGNYLWPAMWWGAFNSDDPINPVLADEMGIVMATSHHEPMMRAQAEWKPYGGKDWNYETNAEQLQKFWKESIVRMDGKESYVTVGMRGDGDMAMSQTTNISLLEKIIADQRKILADVTGKPAEKTPQVWALYKEVQEYYDKGMRVPDDVTLLLCDDNWGDIRKLPKPDAAPRSGGYGIYYHFDYVGGPRNYKWLNTNPLPRVWEQMHMAYEYGIDRIWLVNVGDLKPMELPISFFLDYAWNPNAWTEERLPEYTTDWATQQFGSEHATEIAKMLDLYAKYNGRRKPELIVPETYNLNNFQEAETIVADYNQLAKKAEELGKKLPAQYQDAYYELVLHPITACANLNEMYFAAAKNRQAAAQGRATAGYWGEKVKALFAKDAEITKYYHTNLAKGKWDLMMSQTHIGYTSWQQPDLDKMPNIKEISIPEGAEMGIAIEGSDKSWTNGKTETMLPEMNSFEKKPVYIDIFNKGTKPFDYEIRSNQTWLKIDKPAGKVEKETRIWISADWAKVPEGKNNAEITILQKNGKSVILGAITNNQKIKEFKGFVEANRYISMEAEHFSRNIPANGIAWKVIPDLGRTLSAMAVFPVKAPIQVPGKDCPHLEYDLYLSNSGEKEVNLYVSPSLNYFNDEGLKVAVSIDDQAPQILAFNKTDRAWNNWVSDNIIKVPSKHQIENPGKHILKVWMVSPGVVLQKIVVNSGDKKSSYLSEPESVLIK